MTRVLRLTLLAPDIVEAILDGRQGPEVMLANLLEPFPFEWAMQEHHFGWQPSAVSEGLHQSVSLPGLT